MKKYIIKHQRRGVRPLYYNENYILVSKGCRIYKCSLDLERLEFIVKLPIKSIFLNFFFYFPLLRRIFRLDPSKTDKVGEHQFIIFRRSEVWFVDVHHKVARLEFIIPEGRRILDCTQVNFNNSIPMLVFGEYFDNPERKPVSIWGRVNENSSWIRLFTFDADEINHIHSIVFDIKRKVVWILTGDFEHSAGIWAASLDFKNVQPVLRGNQIYRAAWLTEISGRLIYATDTPLEDNGVYELLQINGVWLTLKIDAMDASSIYRGQSQECFFFSTSVEPAEVSNNSLSDLLSRKRGVGIHTTDAKIYSIDHDIKIKEIFSARKDWIPFRLGQFGNFIFPGGVMPYGSIIAYGVAVDQFHDTCIVLEETDF